jgi:RNA methyltransferase, TrmH family
MLSTNTIKHLRSLSIKKYRNLYGKFIAEGPKIVSELAGSNLKISDLYALQNWVDANSTLMGKVGSLNIITEEQLNKISSLSTPNQVLAVVEIPEIKFNAGIAESSMIIALDDIRDPGNLGTIIRIADWFGMTHIVCSENSVDTYNPKTVQASMGSISRVQIYYENIADLINSVSQSIIVYGAFLEGKPIYEESFAKNGIIVIGNEANGISPEIEKLVSKKISIPSGNNNGIHAESLNASIATAIICSEMNRQKAFL